MQAGLYRHYKGGIYQVIGIGEHTETKQRVVVYVSLDANQPGPRIRVRPLNGPDGWNTAAQIGPGKYETRFVYIGDEPDSVYEGLRDVPASSLPPSF